MDFCFSSGENLKTYYFSEQEVIFVQKCSFMSLFFLCFKFFTSLSVLEKSLWKKRIVYVELV